MRIGVDAMGGDHAPGVEVQGALLARGLLEPGERIVLVGNESAVRECLAEADAEDWQESIEIRHAEQVIGMAESPVEALRSKPDSSIAVVTQMHADGEVDACVSAGNTGAFVAASQMRLRRLPGVHRPGICVMTPTYHGPLVVCDVGANVNCRPRHLHQYAVMALVYARSVCGIASPRVGLLSIGQEDAKGNNLVKQTHELLQGDPDLRFVGNVEGRGLFQNVCDVVVCDGFVGNVVLKMMESMAGAVIRTMLDELGRTMLDERREVTDAAQSIITKYDPNEYGGAPLLGVAGISIICHGASNPHGIMNGLRVALEVGKLRVNEQIVELFSKDREPAHE